MSLFSMISNAIMNNEEKKSQAVFNKVDVTHIKQRWIVRHYS